MTEVARNARQVNRTLDAASSTDTADMADGLPLLLSRERRNATGSCFSRHRLWAVTCQAVCPQANRQPDSGRGPRPVKLYAKRQVVLVSKDINMRIKARAFGSLLQKIIKTIRPWMTVISALCGLYGIAHEFFGAGMAKRCKAGNRDAFLLPHHRAPSCNTLINQFVYF